MCVFFVLHTNGRASETGAAKIESVSILAEPLPFKSGAPLSARAMVARPGPIKGLISWSIETRRHHGVVFSAAISPDGRLVATGGLDGTIRIWDAQTGKFSRALIGHNNYVFALDWSPDGKYLASAGAYDSTARIWDAESGRLLRTLKHSPYVLRLAWSSNGRQLILSGGESGQTVLFDAVNGTEMGKLEVGQRIMSIAWSPDGRLIAIGVNGQGASLIDAMTFKARNAVGEGGEAVAMSWSPDSQHLAVASAKGTLIWNTVESKQVQKLPPAVAAAWSPDGDILAIAPSNGPIEFWDPLAKMNVEKLPLAASGLEWSADGELLMSNFADLVAIWDMATSKVRHTIDVGGKSPNIEWLSGKFICSGIGTDTVSLSTVAGNHVRDLKGTAKVKTVALTPNAKVLAVGGAAKDIHLFEIATGNVLSTLKGHSAAVTCVAWSQNGKTLASCSDDKSVRIWDAPTGKLEYTLEGHTGSVAAVNWFAKTLASAGADSQAILWNAGSGQKIKSLALKNPVESLARTEDGKYLATGDRGSNITLWDVATGVSLNHLERVGNPPGVSALAWSPKLPLIASGRANHKIQLWDTRNGKLTHDISALAPVISLSWAGGGSVVVAGTDDRCLRSWDATNGNLLATIVGDQNRLLIINAEGHYQAVSDSDPELVFVAQTELGQQTYSPKEFTSKFGWKNASQVKFIAR
jgi:WD40 repeat protein